MLVQCMCVGVWVAASLMQFSKSQSIAASTCISICSLPIRNMHRCGMKQFTIADRVNLHLNNR